MSLRNFAGIFLFSLSVFSFSCSNRQVSLRINVVTPSCTPKDAKIYIAGNHTSAGDWDPGKVEMQKSGDSIWTFAATFPINFIFKFKITRGSWNNQAIYKQGEIPPDCQITLKSDTVLVVRPVFWSDSGFKLEGGITGTVKYHRAMTGDGLRYPRDLVVWLPPSYDKNTAMRYPVLYMHDGENIVDPSTSFGGYDWHIDEVADSLIRAKRIKEIIVVGIYNTPDRREEYSDTDKGRSYMKFIVEKVKPMIDSVYRTLPSRENTSVMGSSLGGLISFLMVWNYSGVFSHAGCVSPAFWDNVISSVGNYSGPDKGIRIYIDNGGLGLEKQLLPGCEKMVSALKSKGFDLNKNLEWFYDSTADHSERSWARRVWRPLVFMYGRQNE